MQIYFDNTSLMANPYSVRTIDHDSSSPRQLNTFNLARQRGSVLVNTDYQSKTIKITGVIFGANLANLERNIDDFKELLSRQGKNLDIDYAGDVRRYIATAVKIDVPRDSYHITFAPYTVEFLIPSGVGRSTNADSVSVAGILIDSYVDTLSIGGTANPKPKLSLSFVSANTVSKIEFLANGDKITISENISADDIVVIDCENLQVTINGLVVDYTGIFPAFGVGANVYEIEVTSVSHEYNINFNFYKFYI